MAATYDITIDQGATFSLGLIFRDALNVAIDLTSATIKSQIRPSAESQTILAELTATKDPLVTGRVVLSLASDKTFALDFDKAVYDVLVTIGSTKTRYIEGAVTLSKAVTR